MTDNDKNRNTRQNDALFKSFLGLSDALLVSHRIIQGEECKTPRLHAEQFDISMYTVVASATVQAPDTHHLHNVFTLPHT